MLRRWDEWAFQCACPARPAHVSLTAWLVDTSCQLAKCLRHTSFVSLDPASLPSPSLVPGKPLNNAILTTILEKLADSRKRRVTPPLADALASDDLEVPAAA